MPWLVQELRTTDWQRLVNIFSALLTPTIAIIAVSIAWRQHKTNRNQFRLALLERRMKVFDATGELIGKTMREARVEIADLQKFLWDTRESFFLFGPDIANCLKQLYEKAVDVHALIAPEQAREQGEALLWFSGQGDMIKEKFGKYMAFKEAD
jgi:hypothetical protein